MIREDLLEFQYYLDRLSKFMQESYGIDEQVRTFHSLLTQIDTFYNEFLKNLQIFKNVPTDYPEGSEILNNLGEIFNCKRNFTIPIYPSNDPLNPIGFEKINLSNEEFLIYIKTQIVKQNFDGRRSTLRKLYSTFENGKKVEDSVLDLIFLYTTNPLSGAECEIRWNIENPSPNLRKLFLAGYLTIESMGIQYTRKIENFDNLSYFPLVKYSLLEKEPVDWPNDFYEITATDASSIYDENKIYGIFKEGSWIILEREPVDWANEVYKNYKELTITQVSAGTIFEGETYFEYIPLKKINLFNQEQYHLLTSEPADWPKNCYEITSSSSSSNFDPNAIYGHNESYGYSLLKNRPVVWGEDSETNYTNYDILTINEVAEGTAFIVDTYYIKEEVGGELI